MNSNITPVDNLLPFDSQGENGSSPGNGRLLASTKGAQLLGSPGRDWPLGFLLSRGSAWENKQAEGTAQSMASQRLCSP